MIASGNVFNVANLKVETKEPPSNNKMYSNDEDFKNTLYKSRETLYKSDNSMQEERRSHQVRRNEKEHQQVDRSKDIQQKTDKSEYKENDAQQKTDKSEHRENGAQQKTDASGHEGKDTQQKTDKSKHEENNVKQKSQVDNDKKAKDKQTLDEENLKLGKLSEQEKKYVKNLSNELGINPEELINLLNLLKIDLNFLQKFESVGKAAQNVKNSLQNFINKIKDIANLNFDKDMSLKEKIQMLQDIQKSESDLKSKLDLIKQAQAQKNDTTKQTSEIQQDKKTEAIQNNQKSEEATNKVKSNSQQVETNNKSDNQVYQSVKQQSSSSKTTKSTNNVNISENAQHQTKSASGNNNQSNNQSNNQNNNQNQNDASKLFENAKVINLKSTKNSSDSSGEQQNLVQFNQGKFAGDKFVSLRNTAQTAASQKQNIFNQITESAKILLKNDQTQMELNLKPDNLGKLSLKISTENGVVAAKITAQTQQVRDVLESNLGQLKQVLKEQGLNIQELDVSVGQDPWKESFERNFSKQKSRGKLKSNVNSVEVSENYTNVQHSKNPYLVSQNKVDYVV